MKKNNQPPKRISCPWHLRYPRSQKRKEATARRMERVRYPEPVWTQMKAIMKEKYLGLPTAQIVAVLAQLGMTINEACLRMGLNVDRYRKIRRQWKEEAASEFARDYTKRAKWQEGL